MGSDRTPLPDLLPSWLWRLVLWCLALLVVARTLDLLTGWLTTVLTVTAALVAALLLTALLVPVHRRLARPLPDWLAALTTILLTLAALGAVGYVVVSRALRQVGDLQVAVNEALSDLQSSLLGSSLPFVPSDLRLAQFDVMGRLSETLPSPSGLATMASEILAGMALAVFAWFFLLKDGPVMWRWFVGWVPGHRREAADRVGRGAWHVVERYMQGMTLVALLDAIGIGGAMLALGVPLVASLTCVVFVGAFVPVVGAFVSGGLAVLVTLVLLGPTEALILLAAVFLVQQIEGNVLQPLVMGKVLHLHPLPIVVAVSVGALLGGVLGAVVAVPLVAVAYRVARELRGPRDSAGEPGASPGEPSSAA